MSRTVIFHYHLFKNAGTSVDQVLKENFGERWVTREFTNKPAKLHAQEVAQWVQDNPEALAFSSHTAELPLPEVEGVEFIPVIYVRQPLDRIASAYAFETKQGGAGFGAVLARNTSLAGYVEVRLSMPRDRQCRNFQSSRFARMFAAEGGTEREQALKAAQALPFIGVVEDFAGSMNRLEALLKPHFPDFKVRHVAANVSRDLSLGMDERLAQLRQKLGDAVFEQVRAANEDDEALYQAVCARFLTPAEAPAQA
ncbi:sulfotransferase family 2 domain-containing protein [Ideonella livida]|uniref:Sulfotransferase family 2 domain-containing protein n=1 Tax=Ideonella livida TaxID=2707176 RepID=A0A7C9PKK0_9BURK|nr:sulfotransferase family 2 domain-containing protein [Ideonella livida]NDY93374.1 sulfotransferase family 2 domain-containing protein [Ideonella livida]